MLAGQSTASSARSDQPQRDERREHPAALSAAASILAIQFSPPMTCACTAAMACALPPRAMVSDFRNFDVCRHCEALPTVIATAQIKTVIQYFAIMTFMLEECPDYV